MTEIEGPVITWTQPRLIRLSAHVIYAKNAAERGTEFANMVMHLGGGKAPRLKNVCDEYGIPHEWARTWKKAYPILADIKQQIHEQLGI